jgi:LysR family glycine cleavage system transcriptional activator
MKMRDLPPLNALHSFSLAAHSLSFREAAESLHLTPSAVSHRIKSLEAHLGTPLFHRHNRTVRLTEAGQRYLLVVDSILLQLRDASAQIASRHARPSLRLSIGSFIAAEWLLPALPEFRAAHPEIEIIIETDLRSADLSRDDVDIALRFGSGHWTGVTAHRLIAIQAVPVCAPALLPETLSASTIGALPRLESTPVPDGWSMWASAAGIELPKAEHSLHLDSYQSLIQAAEGGLGIALGMRPLIDPILDRGRLVPAWPEAVRVPFSYFLLHRPGDESRPEIAQFLDWVKKVMSRIG